MYSLMRNCNDSMCIRSSGVLHCWSDTLLFQNSVNKPDLYYAKKTNLCHVALWCGQHLVLMEIGASVFACVIFWGGVVGCPGGCIWGKQRLLVLLGGQSPHTSTDSDSHTPALICCGVWPVILWLDQRMWWTLLTSFLCQFNHFAVFQPFSEPKLVKYLLMGHHRRAGGHHYGVVHRVKHSIARHKAISLPFKSTSNGGEVAYLFLFGKTKWLALHRHAVHECWLTRLSNVMHSKPDVSVCVCLCGGERAADQ